VKVDLVANDPRVQIMDYQPQQVRVTLDPLFTKQVSVRVTYGTPPAGLHPGTPIPSQTTVAVSGAASIVAKVAYAEAAVQIDASGLDVSQDPSLVARDLNNNIVDKVSFNPRQVNVKIQVVSQSRSETVPINPPTVGTPASGYYVASVDVQPPVVLVRGQADALARLAGKASTKAISISGATGDVTAQVDLDLPDGVTADLSTTVTVVVHLRSDPISRSVTIGVAPAGAHSNLVYTLSTPSVVVTLGGATASLNAFDTSTLVGTVFVGDLGVGVHTLSVSVSVPPGIKVVAINPAQITVTITVAVVTPIPSPPATP
jgi:YbbR domain-containing protein